VPEQPAASTIAAAVSEESQRVYGEVFERERRAALEIISRGRHELTVLELGRDACEWTAAVCDVLDECGKTVLPLACRAGCAWCCYLQVSITAPEAVLVAEYLRQSLSAEALAAVTARVRTLDAVTHGMTPQERIELRRPCALLVNDRCSVYEVRPIMCRGWNSADAAQCEAAIVQAESVLDVEHNALIRQAAAGVEHGLLAATREASLAAQPLELTAALRIALESPDAAERWASGEDLFQAAAEPPPRPPETTQ
jgi:uncharacterized protein